MTRAGCLFACLLLALPVMATRVAPASKPDPVLSTIRALSPQSSVSSLTNGPIPGFVTAIVDDQPLYISKDGRFVLQGHLYDMKRGEDLTADHTAASRANVLRRLHPGDLIVMAPPHPKYRVIVFVDTECGYCQSLVGSAQSYLDKGIELDFAAWPRAGVGSPGFNREVSVWCSRDRREAFQTAFRGEEPPVATCASPVPSMLQMAIDMKLPGTPAVLTPEGRLIGGLVPPSKLLRALRDSTPGTPGDGEPTG